MATFPKHLEWPLQHLNLLKENIPQTSVKPLRLKDFRIGRGFQNRSDLATKRDPAPCFASSKFKPRSIWALPKNGHIFKTLGRA
jgi:hypothetical protein